MTFMITCLNNKEMRFYMTFSPSYNLKEIFHYFDSQLQTKKFITTLKKKH